MKKFMWMALVGLMVSGVLAAGYVIGTGFGKIIPVTTAPTLAKVLDSGGNIATGGSLSLYNAGTSTVFCTVNSTVTEFAAQVAAGTAVPIPPALIYSFQYPQIYNVIVATTNGTSSVFVGAH